IVSYSNEVKMKLLGVSFETLKKHGAVSEETAREMAKGVRAALATDVGISTTGIAGPGGGTPEKPVGTVCFGVSSKLGEKSFTKHFGSALSRDEIRRFAANFALSLAIAEAEESAK
ncbi:MAG: nicotinamide-nucleotide amidohydrolase family protein, partial [Clostridia bacterium]|nr:nicotinamide-nucleotide amidohydrolase family protein [Clostridia bacterium]